jgi:PAS domain S-box-containing protein
VGVCQDVTDRVEAEQALGLSERRMRAIIDYSPSIVAVKNLEGRYLMANAEIGRVVGVSPDQLVGKECTELFPTIAEQLRANDRLAAAEMEPVYDEAVLLREGEPRSYLTVTFALPDEAGRPIETCTIATDVTERKERESERRERREWQQRIESALRERRLRAFAQPVVELASGRRVWHELLVRMRSSDKKRTLMSPSSFLPAAERFGLVQSIDIWMVGEALRLASALAPEVNISAVTLCDLAARREILKLLRASPEAAQRIVFEITETAAADHLDSAREFAEELTSLGCGLALDDFGTGFGSFTYLRALPLRYLKIDASFVRNLADSADDRRVVQSIIGIAEQFELLTIAEGVEDDATFRLLRELGADYAQGFHLGRPAAVAR